VDSASYVLATVNIIFVIVLPELYVLTLLLAMRSLFVIIVYITNHV